MQRAGVAATSARLTIELIDGSQLVQEVPEPRGAAANPMTDAEIEAKFHDCWSFPSHQRRNPDAPSALDLLWHVDRLED
jgi:2-methylcitrate dehydratase PrpD